MTRRRDEAGNLTPEAIAAIRAAIGMTQAEFARAVGVEANTVARWERGERRPSLFAQLQILRVEEQEQERQERDRLLQQGAALPTAYQRLTAAELVDLIERRGILWVAATISDPAEAFVVGIRDGIPGLMDWTVTQGTGMALFRPRPDGASQDEPDVLWINAPESQRAAYEAAITGRTERETIVVMGGRDGDAGQDTGAEIDPRTLPF